MFYSLPWKQISSKYLFFIIQVLETQPEIFRDSSVVKAIIRDHQFWQEVEKFRDVLAPAKRAVKNIEAKSSNVLEYLINVGKN
ncbi:7895_t:CDS:2 [Entrophospora sp. SA101]|nr:7895_t:CDS:2 [Entrophospora sp. SA101]